VGLPIEGDLAPEFDLPAEDGRRVRLSELRGREVVLYFYPKDDSPGCTTEACDFRDALPSLAEDGVVILGVSTDSRSSHLKFREKYGLNFPLLADEDHSVAEDYGVWKEKMMYGNRTWGIERSTFLIDASGTVRKVWRRVDPVGHVDQVIAALGERE